MSNKVRGQGNRASKDPASTARGHTEGDHRTLPDTIQAELRYLPTARLMAQPETVEGWEIVVEKVMNGPAFPRQKESAAALDAAPSPCLTHLTQLPVVMVDDDDPDCVPSILDGTPTIIAAHSLELPKVPCLVCSRHDAVNVLRELDRLRERERQVRDPGADYYSSFNDDEPAYLAR